MQRSTDLVRLVVALATTFLCCMLPLSVKAQAEQGSWSAFGQALQSAPKEVDSFWSATHLLNIEQGGRLSDKVAAFRSQSYESATGALVRFYPWYKTSWTDMRVLYLTQFDEQNGLIWGVSTGERGQKYRIASGFTLGFIHRQQVQKNMVFSVQVLSVLGGRLNEKSCIADYGEIGGVQEVNCRLAASILAPQETLRYLLRERPDQSASVKFEYRF